MTRSVATLLAAAPLALAPEVALASTVYVPAPDGAQLATDLHLVAFPSRPAGLMRTPHGRDSLASACLAFNLLGCHCVAQGLCGFGDSSGGDGTVFRHDGDPGTRTPIAARQRLLTEPEHPSALLLPVLDGPRRPHDRIAP